MQGKALWLRGAFLQVSRPVSAEKNHPGIGFYNLWNLNRKIKNDQGKSG